MAEGEFFHQDPNRDATIPLLEMMLNEWFLALMECLRKAFHRFKIGLSGVIESRIEIAFRLYIFGTFLYVTEVIGDTCFDPFLDSRGEIVDFSAQEFINLVDS